MKKLLLYACTLGLLLFGAGLVHAQENITALEYYFNSDPGYGNATSVPFSAGEQIEVEAVIPVSALEPGFHVLYIRAQDSEGNWGQAESRPVFITDAGSASEPSPLTELEYFFNTDPGYGSATTISVPPGTDIVEEALIDTGELAPGFHTLFVRAKNDNDTWGLTESRPIYITEAGTAVDPPPLTEMEYFFNDDPGYGNATSVQFTAGTQLEIQELISIAALDPGFHTLHVRTQNETNAWGLTESRPFYITESGTVVEPEPLVSLEYFIGDDPGYGSGISIPISPDVEIDIEATLETADLPIGSYNVSVRAQNAGGIWGLAETSVFSVSDDFPVPVTLLSPEDEAEDIPINTEFMWQEAGDAETYRFQLAADAGFTEIVADSAGIGGQNTLLNQATRDLQKRAGLDSDISESAVSGR